MDESFDALIRLMGDVKSPIECPTAEDWGRAEADFGLVFPSDFKRFVSMYGSCIIKGTIIFDNPSPLKRFSYSRNLIVNGGRGNLTSALCEQLAEGSFPKEKLSFYPKPGGLLNFGRCDEAPLYWTYTDKDPSAWRIRVIDWRGDRIQGFDIAFTPFMVGFLQGDFKVLGQRKDSKGAPIFLSLDELR